MHPLFGADIGTLMRLWRRDGPVDPAHLPSLALAFASAAARTPFRAYEAVHVARRRRRRADMPPPTFIIGHWRSGTTHLYNILSKTDFGYVSPFAAGLPLEYQTLGRWLRPLLTRWLPKTRYVDQVSVGPESPQEDEIPLGSTTPISFYHGVYFPKQFERHLKRSFFLEGCTDEEVAAWESGCRRFMEKLWLDQGRPLLIKNPTYSARIPQLRRLFPGARFIHIYRNPHAVFRSTRRFYRTLIDKFAWQAADQLAFDEIVLQSYRRMMDKIDVDKRNLPREHFTELRFEDLEAHPIREVERIYRELGCGDIEPHRIRIRHYLGSIEGFQKSQIPETADDRTLVERHCRELFDRFGYAIESEGA